MSEKIKVSQLRESTNGTDSDLVMIVQENEENELENFKQTKQEFLSDTRALIDNKQNKEVGKGLSTNDFTTPLKAKLEGIEAGAEANTINEIDINGIAQVPVNKKIDISVPEKTSDLENDSEFVSRNTTGLLNYTLTTQTGSKIDLEINTSTYVLTAKLYDKNNNLISTSTGIDLPLETMVVGASYDSTTKEIVLTLKNGQTTRFSVADLVSGLQEEITPSNKLNADLVDDTNSTNKFVTSAEKTQISTNATDISNIKNGTTIDSFGDVESALGNKEDISNKSQTLDNSTTKYPSNKAVKDSQDIQDSEIAEMQEIISNIPPAKGTGEEFTIDNTMKCKHVSDELKGNTSQETTTGKNKIDITSGTVNTSTPTTVTKNSDGTITIDGSNNATYTNITDITGIGGITTGQDYKISFAVISGTWNAGTMGLRLYDSNNTQIVTIQGNLNSQETKTISSQVAKAELYTTGAFSSTNLKLGIMLLPSSETATSWEKYTGGIPSPNPSYPSTVNVVKGDNEVKIENKNLCNATMNVTLVSGTEKWSPSLQLSTENCGVKWEQGKTYYIKAFATPQSNETAQINNYSYKNIYNIQAEIVFNGTIPTIRVGANTLNSAITNEEVKIMVSTTSITDYIEHQEQIYPISLGNIELAKIGSYQDKIFKAISGDVVYDSLSSIQKEGLNSGKWYKENDILKVVLDGTEDYVKRTDIPNLSNTSCYRTSINSTINANAMTNTPQVSNKFTCLNNTNDVEHIRYTGAENYRFQVFIDKTRLTTDDATGMKAWATNNNFIIYYVLATPTFTEITDTTLITQLENWRNSKSYQGQTNISQTNEDKAFVISYTTLKDVYSELDSRLKALEG